MKGKRKDMRQLSGHIKVYELELTETPSALLNHHIDIVSRRQPDGSYANGTYITLTLDSNKL